MAHKQAIKKSEARILIFLDQVAPVHRYLKQISNRLDIDYNYCLGIVQKMVIKGWIKKKSSLADSRKMFYDLTDLAPTEEAKIRIAQR